MISGIDVDGKYIYESTLHPYPVEERYNPDTIAYLKLAIKLKIATLARDKNLIGLEYNLPKYWTYRMDIR